MRPSLGRLDEGVVELRLGGFDRGLIGLDRSLELIDPRLLLVHGLLGGDIAHHQGF